MAWWSIWTRTAMWSGSTSTMRGRSSTCRASKRSRSRRRMRQSEVDRAMNAPLTNGSNFFSSGLRQKVDQLMDILWSGGVNNPMDSIEQISYLLFLRLLSEKDEQLAALSKNYKRIFSDAWASRAWGNFVTLTGDQLFDAVRAAME